MPYLRVEKRSPGRAGQWYELDPVHEAPDPRKQASLNKALMHCIKDEYGQGQVQWYMLGLNAEGQWGIHTVIESVVKQEDGGRKISLGYETVHLLHHPGQEKEHAVWDGLHQREDRYRVTLMGEVAVAGAGA